jgi:hypothetical protein
MSEKAQGGLLSEEGWRDRPSSLVRPGLVRTVVAVALLALVGQASARPSKSSSPSINAACAPGYEPCLPIRRDLDCNQIAEKLKPIRVTGMDQYGLDIDNDGLGCPADWDRGSGMLSRWGVIIRKPLRKEAQVVRMGNKVWVAGWSPKAFKGRRFEICTLGTRRGRCVKAARRLNGRNQLFSTWTVRRGDTSGTLLRLGLRVNGRGRADDAVLVE